MSGSVDNQDSAFKVYERLISTAAFTAGPNLELDRSSNVPGKPKGPGELVESSAPRAIDPRIK